jgi:hypothetical protein
MFCPKTTPIAPFGANPGSTEPKVLLIVGFV